MARQKQDYWEQNLNLMAGLGDAASESAASSEAAYNAQYGGGGGSAPSGPQPVQQQQQQRPSFYQQTVQRLPAQIQRIMRPSTPQAQQAAKASVATDAAGQARAKALLEQLQKNMAQTPVSPASVASSSAQASMDVAKREVKTSQMDVQNQYNSENSKVSTADQPSLPSGFASAKEYNDRVRRVAVQSLAYKISSGELDTPEKILAKSSPSTINDLYEGSVSRTQKLARRYSMPAEELLGTKLPSSLYDKAKFSVDWLNNSSELSNNASNRYWILNQFVSNFSSTTSDLEKLGYGDISLKDAYEKVYDTRYPSSIEEMRQINLAVEAKKKGR
jgi:hypothetical protein